MLGYFPSGIRIGSKTFNFQNEKPYYWNRPFRSPIELYRCKIDGLLLSDNMLTKGYCAGHHLSQPVRPTLVEFILIYIGVIR